MKKVLPVPSGRGKEGSLKFFTTMVLLIGATALLQAVAPIVTSPMDTDHWPLGSTRIITWLANGCTGNISIEIFRQDGSGTGMVTTVCIPALNQQYEWIVGDLQAGSDPLVAGGVYQLHVINLDEGTFGRSGKFTVTPLLIDIHVELKRIRYIEFKWPPQPDPCLCPDFDLRRLSDVLGPLSFPVSIALLKNGQQVQQLGSFAMGSRLPASLKAQLSQGDFNLLKRNGARFALVVLGARGKILSQHDLQSHSEMTRR
jgi:hypothetical protein